MAPDRLGLEPQAPTTPQCVTVTRPQYLLVPRVTEGMIGFDIACETVRSGSRMQGYLVNDLCKQQVPMLSAPTSLSPPRQSR